MKFIVFAFLIAMVVAGGVIKSSKITLKRGGANQINFACGAVDRAGRSGFYKDARNDYSYSFQGHPSWLTVKGTYLVGTCPKNTVGDYRVTVNYRSKDGKRTGSKIFILSTGPATVVPVITTPLVNTVSFFQGGFDNARRLVAGGLGNYVVLYPVIPTNEVPATAVVVTDTSVASSPPSTTSGTAGTTIDTHVPTDTTVPTVPIDTTSTSTDTTGTIPTDTGSGAGTITDTTDVVPVAPIDTAEITEVTTPIDASGATPTDNTSPSGTTTTTGTADNKTWTHDATNNYTINEIHYGIDIDKDYSCNSSVPASVAAANGATAITLTGSGMVTAVDTEYIILDNKFHINFGKCTQKLYNTGRQTIQIKDKIDYKVVVQRRANGTAPTVGWAKTVTCS